MGTGVDELQLQNSIWTGNQGREPNALSGWLEYRPEEGAPHRVQSILKSKHFQIPVIHQRQSPETALIQQKGESPSLKIMKLPDKAIGAPKLS